MSPLSNNMIMSRVASGGGGGGGIGSGDPYGSSFTYRIKNSVTLRNGSDAPGMSYAYDGRSATLGNLDPVGGCFVLESAERNTGNGNKKFTFSFWIKGRHVGTILRHYDDGDSIAFDADDKLVITADEYSARGEFFQLTTEQRFADDTDWSHFVIAVDTTLSNATDRIKIWNNGRAIQYNSSSAISQDTTFSFYDGAVALFVDYLGQGGGMDARFADIKYVDNQQLSASDFGSRDANTDEWLPIAYTFSNSSGDNSWELKFDDLSGNTKTTVGKDTSGNGCHFTPYYIYAREETDDEHCVYIQNADSGSSAYYSWSAAASSTLYDDFKYNVGAGVNSEEWTLSCWVRITDASSNSILLFGTDLNSGSYRGAALYAKSNLTDGNYFHYESNTQTSSGSYNQFQSTSTSSIDGFWSRNCWHHIAISHDYDANAYTFSERYNRERFYVDGVELLNWYTPDVESQEWDGRYMVFYPPAIYTGADGNSGNAGSFEICDLRLHSGALYTSNFTPPTTKNTAHSDDELLVFRGSSLTDDSGEGRAPTANGTVYIRKTSPFEMQDFQSTGKDSPSLTGTDSGNGYEISGTYPFIDASTNVKGYKLPVRNYNDKMPTTAEIVLSSGKWYYEVAIALGPEVTSTDAVLLGVVADRNSLDQNTSGYTDLTSASTPYSHLLSSDSKFYNNGTATSNSTAWGGVDFIGVALDIDNNEIKFYKNGSLIGSAQTLETGASWSPVFFDNTNITVEEKYDINWGQRKFHYPAPSGFSVVNKYNLPSPAIPVPKNYMGTTAFVGTGSSLTISDFDFDPGLVMLCKVEDGTYSNFDTHIYDKNSGATKAVMANSDAAQSTESSGLTAFTTGGFTVGTDQDINNSGELTLAFAWATAASSSTNNNGSIESTVNASTASGVSCVKYVGTGSNATVGHGIGTPSLVLVKDLSSTNDWRVWHKELTGSQYMGLNGFSDFGQTDSTVWNSTAPNSSVLSIGTASEVNTNGNNYMAICFQEIDGFSTSGTYTPHGNANQPQQLWFGFKPELVFIKAISSPTSQSPDSFDQGTQWTVVPSTSSQKFGTTTEFGTFPALYHFQQIGNPNVTGSFGAEKVVCTSSGWTIKHDYLNAMLSEDYTYFYFAWARNPYKYARSGH